MFKKTSEVIVNGAQMIADSDSFILFQPDTPHSYKEMDLPFINDWFHCEGEELGKLLNELNFPLDKLVPAVDPMLISRSIMELHRVQKQGGQLMERILDTDIRALLMKLSNLYELSQHPERPGRYIRQFSELRDELYNSPQSHVTVEMLADRVHLSKSYFQHLYKDIFGCSVVTDMINGRLELAKYLLKNSSLTVSAIAARCGYEHETHFMRQFKKFVGQTPSQFKARV
ncbi:helix-turn-helix transcriptional regulator [Paenibacillus sp. YAF4_2]|uniref:AraC family transcriptional regulator n=1 Tax=Paenibacillus sp. YAF4_2 TaxID=3233085 RepID=UPI003F97F841